MTLGRSPPGELRLTIVGLTLALLLVPTSAQSGHVKTRPGDFFWQLADLDVHFPTGNPYLGGQNFTYCCLKAVNASLRVDNGKLTLLNDWIQPANASVLTNADSRGQFPCGATYNGDPQGAPVVQVDYDWLSSECPGWERSSQTNLNTWLQPLSGFLLPAVIFCLSVPRRRKIHVYRTLFAADIYGYRGLLPSMFGALGAMILVTLDTLIWLCICFAFAGPMILSGLYEAMLDNRMLEFLRIKVQNQKLTLDMRCRLLMIVLIGNLDLAIDKPLEDEGRPVSAQFTAIPEPSVTNMSDNGSEHDAIERELSRQEAARRQSHSLFSGLMLENIPSHHPSQDSRPNSTEPPPRSEKPLPGALQETLSRDTYRPPTYHQRDEGVGTYRTVRMPTEHMRASPWRHMEELLYGIRLYDDDNLLRCLSPRQWPKYIDGRCQEPRGITEKTKRQINKTKTRLRSMLHCQYSFGSIVGAPVIFFLGGFVFALVQSLQNLGDEDTAIGLAFGQWYMTVPHIAIVSGLLLAGNNPNILEGVFATERDEQGDDISILGIQFELAYPSCYKVAWQWLRGHTKKRWINKVIETYGIRRDVRFPGDLQVDKDIEELRTMMALAPLDWFLLLSLTTLLLGVPFILAFLTAFYTPEVGVSCRSLTFLAYAAVEFTQIGLWLWAYAGPPPRSTDDSHEPSHLDFFRRGGWLDTHGFYRPSSTSWFLGPRNTRSLGSVWRRLKQDPIRAYWCLLYYLLAGLFGFAAIFAALGGTLMQLIGVYSAGLCNLTVDHWFEPVEDRPKAVISTNSADMISNAARKSRPTSDVRCPKTPLANSLVRL